MTQEPESTLEETFYMRLALEEAKKAFDADEVPIGAVLIVEGQVISRGYNRVERSLCAQEHAEIVCLREAAKKLHNWRLLGGTLYVTVEPCIMCVGALILSRIHRVVWGCPDPRHGGCESLVSLLEVSHPIHRVRGQGGVLADQAKDLLQKFFQSKR